MAIIVPFCALRFNPEKVERMEDVVTPPYDVIDDRGQAAFKARNPYNMINLDISKSPGVGDVSEERYNSARDYFTAWQEEGVLIRDREPAFYLYNIDYSLPSGLKLTRKGFIGLVQLAEFSEGIVKPHEQTFDTVTSDRLRLMDTCQAQFSQIFSLYSDPEMKTIAALERGVPEQPLYQVRDADGGIHSIRPVTDKDVLNMVRELFTDKAVYIADGHHRYKTSLQYRQIVADRQGEVGMWSPYNYTMMYLCPMEDPGLKVLPTHRLVTLPNDVMPELPSMDELAAMLAKYFHLEEIIGGSREIFLGEVLARMEERNPAAGTGSTMFGLYHAAEDRCFLLTLKSKAAEIDVLKNRPAALQDLDVVVLSDLVVRNILGLRYERIEQDNLVRYFADPDEALDVAVKESVANDDSLQLLFLMNNTRVSQVKKVADENLIMPHKATYFYPKILTGLLLNKLIAEEKLGP
ncbi:MAG: DUF1015 domain-containing protein [Desulfobulbales bacterium]|nr:DUF1015 domain-containing protein [Desulfobulbales bacterium]